MRRQIYAAAVPPLSAARFKVAHIHVYDGCQWIDGVHDDGYTRSEEAPGFNAKCFGCLRIKFAPDGREVDATLLHALTFQDTRSATTSTGAFPRVFPEGALSVSLAYLLADVVLQGHK